jgi:hypothetical protein
MALASVGFFATITLADSGGNKSTLRYELVAADIETAETDTATIITRLNAVTDGVIVGYTVGEAFEENATFLAAEGVQVENVAMLSARISNAKEKYAQLRIPAPTIGIFQQTTGSKSNVVDNTDADLLTYLSTFVTGGLATVSDGEILLNPSAAGNLSGKRIHRGSRKG